MLRGPRLCRSSNCIPICATRQCCTPPHLTALTRCGAILAEFIDVLMPIAKTCSPLRANERIADASLAMRLRTEENMAPIFEALCAGVCGACTNVWLSWQGTACVIAGISCLCYWTLAHPLAPPMGEQQAALYRRPLPCSPPTPPAPPRVLPVSDAPVKRDNL